MDPMESIKATFFQECDELLADLESGLLSLEAGTGDDETVNAVFRAVHSVKGGAGAFGLEALVRFAHVFETALDSVRAGRLAPDHEVLRVMLRAADVLADHVQAAKTGDETDQERSASLARELEALHGASPAAPPSAASPPASDADVAFGDLDFTPVRLATGPEADATPAPALSAWTIRFRPAAPMYAKANDPLPLLRELERLGACEAELDLSDLPPFDRLEPEEAYLAWRVRLDTYADEAAIREVFEFVEGDCDLDVVADAELSDAPAEGDGSEMTVSDVEAILRRALEAEAPADEPMALQAAAPAPVRAEPEDARVAKTADAPAGQTGAGATIRVDLERIDRLINLVGELVINQAMLAQRVAESGLPRSSSMVMGLDELEQLTREIQDSVMAIRAQPVKSVFQRMPRLVREVAAMTGKEVRLVTEGEATEVDKTVIERLSDPITHMIRNAIDHGLETPDDRLAAGKPAEGVVRLSAQHRSGRIVIEVGDDGRGINRERVRQIAIDKGLIDQAVVLSDEEVDNLIFLPGFSTAAVISDVSGRGVGMDVVKRSIQGLGGRISITSRPGEGSTFSLSLPLTLAVLDGMVVSVGEQTLVVPLTSIVETLQQRSEEVRNLGPREAVMAVRNTFVPLLDVGAMLDWRTEPAEPSASVVILVDSEFSGQAALVVDAIQGQRQVVIKSLEANYQQVPGIAAATILGDGRVALILDVDTLIEVRRRAGPKADVPRIPAFA